MALAMAAAATSDRDLSVPLSRALDEVGLNELTVKMRRETCLYDEIGCLICTAIIGDGHTKYNFGSQSEGTTTPGLCSDFDVLCYRDDHVVIRELSEWTRGKTNLLMLQENTAPGYCRLQLMKMEKPEPEVTPPANEIFVYDSCHRVTLKSKDYGKIFLQDIRSEFQTNGPAETLTLPDSLNLLPDTNLIDKIRALKCTPSFKLAEIWARRHRCGDWPSQDLIEQVVKEPTFVVPVGHKLSQTPDLEWRISASLAERRLMFSLNIIQIKCYVLLKMLIVEYVTPFTGKCFSSYHCKTALFYCMEHTGTEFWREENLLNCVIRCLRMLYTWVSNDVCPHYIVTGANLFDGKVTPQNKYQLLFILKQFISNIRIFLLNMSIDNIGHVLNKKLESTSNIPVLDSETTVKVLIVLEKSRYIRIAMQTAQLHSLLRAHETPILFAKHCLNELYSLLQHANDMKRKVIGQLTETTARYLGSLLASSALSRNDRVQHETIELLQTGATHDVSARLKLASVLYCSGDLEKVMLLLQEIAHYVSNSGIISVCLCGMKHYSQVGTGNLCQSVNERENKAICDVLLGFCITFNLHEINCAPLALHYELFSSVRDDIQ